MNNEDLQLEDQLDAVLDGAEFGTPKLAELKHAGDVFVAAHELTIAENGFNKLLLQLSEDTHITKHRTWAERFPRAFGSGWRTFGTVFASFLIMWFVAGSLISHLVINQLIQATSSNSPTDLAGASYEPSARGGATLMLTNELSAPVALQTGLGSTDQRITIARLLNPINAGAALVEVVTEKFNESGNDYSVAPDYYPTYNIKAVSDTREFLKVSYYAHIKTVHPDTLAERAQVFVRGFGGRIDQAVVSERGSSIHFVVPKQNFDLFRAEINTMAHARFITEDISWQNLLPEKQAIENDTKQINDTLDALIKKRDELTKTHNALVNSLTKQLNDVRAKIKNLDVTLSSPETTDTDREAAKKLKAQYVLQNNILYNKIYDENVTYKGTLDYQNRQIEGAKATLDALAEADSALLENVETVQGTLHFTKINYWQTIHIYLGTPLFILLLLGLGLVVIALIRRVRKPPEVEPIR